jgi:hypothetical protein
LTYKVRCFFSGSYAQHVSGSIFPKMHYALHGMAAIGYAHSVVQSMNVANWRTVSFVLNIRVERVLEFGFDIENVFHLIIAVL